MFPAQPHVYVGSAMFWDLAMCFQRPQERVSLGASNEFPETTAVSGVFATCFRVKIVRISGAPAKKFRNRYPGRTMTDFR